MDLFPASAPGFDDPVGVLRACHGRIERHCATLLKLPEHLRAHGCDADAREAAARILRYFTSAAVDHHQDEEQDLFPALRGLDPGLGATIERLEGEHRTMAQVWADVEALLQRLDSVADLDAFAARAQAFAETYRRHIALEDAEVLRPAETLLSPQHRQAIGTAMAARRGLPHPG